MPATRAVRSPHVVDVDVADVALFLERSLSWLRRALRPTEWNAVALSTLDAVDRLGPLRVTDLVARERITQPGMTGLVGRLETAGLVSRRPDPLDGRATLVEVTPAGADYLRALHERRAEVLADHIGRLPPTEQEALVAASGALAALAALPLDREGI